MYYPDEVIEEVRMKNDIVDVISGYVKLQKKGANYFGLCPFHNEKSPSFSVSPGKQMYYCFGCGAGGNVLTFVMEYENYTFQEALQSLADRAGVTLPKMEYSKEAREQAEFRARLLEVNKLAANYFYYQLKQPQGKIGYDYLVKRKLTDETIRRFGLGFSNKISDDLYRDFQMLDVTKLQGGQKTATEITAAYQSMDNKVDQFEYCVIDFLQALFKIVGIEDEPSFTRSKVTNQLEQTQMVLLAANYLDDETILNKLPWLTQEEVAEILKRKAAEDIERSFEPPEMVNDET